MKEFIKKIFLRLITALFVIAIYCAVRYPKLYKAKLKTWKNRDDLLIKESVYVTTVDSVTVISASNEPSSSLTTTVLVPDITATPDITKGHASAVKYKPRLAVIAPAISDIRGDDLLGCDIIETQETEPDENNVFWRIRLMRTNFKYPLLRTEEAFKYSADLPDRLIRTF